MRREACLRVARMPGRLRPMRRALDNRRQSRLHKPLWLDQVSSNVRASASDIGPVGFILRGEQRMARITFLGAAETVTGSKYLLEAGKARVLIDCGLFQGLKELRERNWQPLPFSAGQGAERRADARPHRSRRLSAAVRQGRFRRPGLLDPADRRPGRVDAARLGQERDRRRRVRQPQGLFQASAGAAAVRHRRRQAGDEAVSHRAPRRVVFAGRADLGPLPRRRPPARLEHDRSRNPRPARAAADAVLGRRRPLRRAAVFRSGAAARPATT